MSELSDAVARQLPYLRRYARAVLGNQAEGDGAVKRCLEALLQKRSELTLADLRLLMYRALEDACKSDDPDHGSAPVSAIERLSPHKRRLLALTRLEGFSATEAAWILRIDDIEARGLLDEAWQDLRRQQSTRILIIEDEPVIALDIASTVRRNGHSVVGIATTRSEAVAMAMETQPGLVLADIQLADDSSGIDAVNEILADHQVPVIFITAFPERLLTGERPEPTFLITKPFDSETLNVSIFQALATAASGTMH